MYQVNLKCFHSPSCSAWQSFLGRKSLSFNVSSAELWDGLVGITVFIEKQLYGQPLRRFQSYVIKRILRFELQGLMANTLLIIFSPESQALWLNMTLLNWHSLWVPDYAWPCDPRPTKPDLSYGVNGNSSGAGAWTGTWLTPFLNASPVMKPPVITTAKQPRPAITPAAVIQEVLKCTGPVLGAMIRSAQLTQFWLWEDHLRKELSDSVKSAGVAGPAMHQECVCSCQDQHSDLLPPVMWGIELWRPPVWVAFSNWCCSGGFTPREVVDPAPTRERGRWSAFGEVPSADGRPWLPSALRPWWYCLCEWLSDTRSGRFEQSVLKIGSPCESDIQDLMLAQPGGEFQVFYRMTWWWLRLYAIPLLWAITSRSQLTPTLGGLRWSYSPSPKFKAGYESILMLFTHKKQQLIIP